MRKLYFIFAACALLCAGSALPDPVTIEFPFDITTETNPDPAQVGPVTVILKITPRYECNQLGVTAEGDHMVCHDTISKTAAAAMGETTTLSWDADVSPNDTCGLVFVVTCGEYRQKAKIYWVTVGDSVVTFPGNPRLAVVHQYDPDSITVPIKNTTRRPRGNHRCRVVEPQSETIPDSLTRPPDSGDNRE